MKVLVTGGAGYVGSAVVPMLQERGHEVVVLDDFSLSSPRNLAGSFGSSNGDTDGIEFVRGDIRDTEAVRRAVDGVDSIIHLAGITGASDTHEIRKKTIEVNHEGVEKVLDESESEDVERFVLASSCNVYGGSYSDDLTEDDDPDPMNPYSEAKLMAEERCKESEVETVSLRLATNYGWSPGVRFNLVVNSFVFRALADETLTVYGDGSNWRPFIHVKDAARAFVEALSWDEGVYNTGGENYTIDGIAETVSEVVGTDVKTEYLRDENPGPSYHVSFDKVSDQGFSLEHSLREGVRDLRDRFLADRAKTKEKQI
ncbi:NAD-dependent epimerase/dehydratase family protein [Halorutilales archaeon Cl-col2-1]